MTPFKAEKGKVLLSDPFLNDPNFIRSVVLLLQNNKDGALGFVLNQKLEITLDDLLMDETIPTLSVYQGGPVEMNTLHFLHCLGDLIPDSIQVLPGLYWGGNFESALTIVKQNPFVQNEIRFFVGYSGWDMEQLQAELEEESWVVTKIIKEDLFEPNFEPKNLWNQCIERLGGQYKHLVNSPLDPKMN